MGKRIKGMKQPHKCEPIISKSAIIALYLCIQLIEMLFTKVNSVISHPVPLLEEALYLLVLESNSNGAITQAGHVFLLASRYQCP